MTDTCTLHDCPANAAGRTYGIPLCYRHARQEVRHRRRYRRRCGRETPRGPVQSVRDQLLYCAACWTPMDPGYLPMSTDSAWWPVRWSLRTRDFACSSCSSPLFPAPLTPGAWYPTKEVC